MSRLPSLKPRQVVAALERCGFTVVRVVGSHYQLFNETTRRHTTVPHHNRDLPRGTVSAIIQQAGLTREEFLKAVLTPSRMPIIRVEPRTRVAFSVLPELLEACC